MTEISLVDLLRVMHAAESSMRVVVNAQTAKRPLEWRIAELAIAQSDLRAEIEKIERAIDERFTSDEDKKRKEDNEKFRRQILGSHYHPS